MVGVLKLLISKGIWKLAVLTLVFATAVNVMVVPKAMAGGAIMVGFTIVTGGKDRVNNKTYRAFPSGPLGLIDGRRYLPQPSVIRVYPGDNVRFTGVIWNVDPFPIPGVAVLQVHQKGFNDPLNPLNQLEYFPNRNSVMSSTVFTVGTGLPVVPGLSNYVMAPPPVTLASNAKPGQQFCQFISTLPMFYLGYIPVVPWFEWKIPDLINFNLGFGGGGLSGSASDANGNSYDVDFDPNSSGDSTIGSDGQTYDTHETFNITFGRTMSCAEVAYVYDLEPKITVDESSNTGSTVDVDATVSEGNWKVLQPDAPAATVTQKTQWQVSRLFVPSDETPPSTFTQYSGRDACTFFRSRPYQYDCAVSKQSGSNVFNRKNTIFSSGAIGAILSVNSGSNLPSRVDIPSDVPDGMKLCYVLSVNSHRPVYPEWNSRWRNSKVVCLESVIKKPRVKIFGDDVRVGGEINTSLTDSSTKTYGSWGEYASYSRNKTEGFATASGLSGGMAIGRANAQMNWSKLTFANTSIPYGWFYDNAPDDAADNLRETFRKYVEGHSTSGNVTIIKSSSDITINPSTLPGEITKGKTYIIYSDGKVTIDRNIKYTPANLRSVDEIPQVVIVAKKIVINENVDQVDAWLIADGDGIVTCPVDSSGKLTLKYCKKQLVVNGPVATTKLYLNRTYSGPNKYSYDSDEAAEIFNNNGASYLWMNNFFRTSDEGIATTFRVELPPRL